MRVVLVVTVVAAGGSAAAEGSVVVTFPRLRNVLPSSPPLTTGSVLRFDATGDVVSIKRRECISDVATGEI